MQWMTRAATLGFIALSLAGCFGSDEGAPIEYEPRTVEINLIINPDRADLPLYTLNDGQRTMNVVAMGFQLQGDEDPLTVPGPQIRVKEGDTVIVRVLNSNPLPHTFHLHGNLDDWTDDGVPYVSQMPIHNNDDPATPEAENEFEYVFENIKAGTYWYHCHVDVAHHIDLGMYGAFIVEEREPTYEYDHDLDEHVFMLDEWDNCHVHQSFNPIDPRTREQSSDVDDLPDCAKVTIQDNLAQNFAGNTAGGAVPGQVRDPLCDVYDNPAISDDVKDAIDPLWRQVNCDQGHGTPPPQQSEREWYYTTFPVYKPNYNTFLLNGKAFPDTKPVLLEQGDSYRMRFINVGEEIHAMHIHGHSFLVTHRDGFELPAPYRVDTLSVLPGERYDVILEADNPGFWVFHDHVGLNVMNDDHAPGGMFTMIGYQGFLGQEWSMENRALDLMDFTYAHHSEGHDHGA